MACPACHAPEATLLGDLGNRRHLRCRACGMDYSHTVKRRARPCCRTNPDGVVRVLNATRYKVAHPDAEIATCGTCGRSWDDGVCSSLTPTPSGRCPYEGSH